MRFPPRRCRNRTRRREAACFSKTREGEFETIVEKTASAEMIVEFKKMFAGASVRETRAGSDPDRVSVVVNLPADRRGKETLNVVREGGGWRVAGF